MYVIGSRSCAAVHSPWMPYIALPSPTIAAIGRPGSAMLMPTAPGNGEAETAAREAVVVPGSAERKKLRQAVSADETFVDDHCIARQGLGEAQHQVRRVDRRSLGSEQRIDACLVALRAPVFGFQISQATGGSGAVSFFPGEEGEGTKRFLDVCLHRDVGAVVLAELVRALGDVDHRKILGQRLERAVDRHAQEVGAEAQQQVVRLQRGAHLLLLPRERAHERRVRGGELRRVGHRGDWYTAAPRSSASSEASAKASRSRELLAGDDHRAACAQQQFRDFPQRLI